jgi:hypothetical protein
VTELLLLFVLLLVGHAIADSVLQPEWLSQRKYDPDPDVASTALLIHGAVHALPVALVTGLPMLALVELFVHPLIDVGKSRGWYGMWSDQLLHVACKVAWVAVLWCVTGGI